MTAARPSALHLYLVRHSVAYEPDEWSGPDETRALNDEGKYKIKAVISKLKQEKKLHVEALWSSPLVRALQTAHIIGQEIDLPVRQIEALRAGASLKALQAYLLTLPKVPAQLMLVGHEPDCGEIIGDLVGDSAGHYALKKAGVAYLRGSFQPGGMSLLWKFDPKQML